MMTSRVTGLASKILLAVILIAGCASAQYVPVARVASVSGDIVTLKGGADLGFQSGDILVVQREGVKVALLRVDKVSATSSEASVINAGFGYNIEKGDEAAYELLRNGRSRTVSVYTADEYWEYPNDYIPSFVELFQEKVPPLPRSDLDYEIERQKRVLEQQPHSREAMVRLADAYFRKDWFELSIYWYQRAIQEEPRAKDADKLMYQIVRGYGALGRPDKQKLYMDYLRVNFPSSVFTTFETQLDIIEPTVQLLPEWQRHPPKRVHMQKGGMRALEKGGMQLIGESEPGPIHGAPAKLAPPDKGSESAAPAAAVEKKAETKPAAKTEDKKKPASKKSEDSKKKVAKKSAPAETKQPAAGGSCAATVVAISGDAQVMLKSAGSGDWTTAELNQCLQRGDQVKTGAEGLMQLEYGTGGDNVSTVKMNAATTATIGKL